MRQNIVFVGGAGRSGTTYLAHALSKFESISTGVESQWISELLKQDVPNNEWVPFVKKHWKVSTSPRKISIDQWEELTVISKENVISQFCYKLLGFLAENESSIIVDHTPSNIVNFKILSENFPEAKFLHIIRDGRGVFASLKKVVWGPNTAFAAAEYWVRFLAHGFIAKSLSSEGQYREVRYEKLLKDPSEINNIYSWVVGDLSATNNLNPNTKKVYTDIEIPSYAKTQHALVNMGPKLSRIDAWKNELCKKEIAAFEKIAGNFLTNFGYVLEHENNEFVSRKYRLYMSTKEYLVGSVINPLRNFIRTKGKHFRS